MAALARPTERARLALIEQGIDVLATFDERGSCTSLNARGRETLGLDPARFDLGVALGADRQHLVAEVLPGLVGAGAWAGDLAVEGAAGRRYLDARIIADRGRGGRVRGWTLVATDVTAARCEHAELMYRATHDALTGLANRSLLLERIGQSLAAHRSVEIVFCDLIGFKAVNDTFGHDAGDAALCEVGRRLQEAVGAGGLAARLGGDEFVVLVPGGWADPVASLRRSVFAAPVVVGGRPLAIDARMGRAMSHAGDTAHDVLVRADRAMYLAATEAGVASAR